MRWYYVRVSEAPYRARQPEDRYYGFGTMQARADYMARDPKRRVPVTAVSVRKVPVHYFHDTRPDWIPDA